MESLEGALYPFDIIAAVCSTEGCLGIGCDGKIPWAGTEYGKDDMEFFRTFTMGGIVICGRKTYESIGSPLIGRLTIVVTTLGTLIPKEHINTGNVIIARSFDEAVRLATSVRQGRRLWVIGGSQVYAEAIKHPQLMRIYVTRIPGSYHCTKHFPRIDKALEKKIQHKSVTVEVYVSNCEELKYLDLLKKLSVAPVRPNRTGVPTRGLFAEKLEFSLTRGDDAVLPLLTTKKVPFGLVKAELLWFLSGKCTDVSYLHENNCHIWDDNTTAQFIESRGLKYTPGETGPIYGYQWRHWNKPYISADLNTQRKNSLEAADSRVETESENVYFVGGYSVVAERKNEGIDQIAQVIKTLRTDPTDRRMIVSAWNPEQIPQMVLPPCHWSFQFHCDVLSAKNTEGAKNTPKYSLNCLVNMRSADVALGVPFNIASYALLTHMIAKCVNMRPGKLVLVMADCHLYTNHIEGMQEQISRQPYLFPTIKFTDDIIAGGDMEQFKKPDQIIIEEYISHPAIKYKMTV